MILGAIAVALLVTGAALLVFTPGASWESQATLLIDQPRAIAVSQDPGVIDKLARLRFKYAGIATTDEYADFVAERSQLSSSAIDNAEILAVVPPESLLLHLGARGNDEQTVEPLATAAAESMIAFVEAEHEDANVPQNERFSFEIVSPAGDADRVDGSRSGIALTLLAAGVVIAGGAVVVSRWS